MSALYADPQLLRLKWEKIRFKARFETKPCLKLNERSPGYQSHTKTLL